MSNVMINFDQNQSSFLPYYRSLLPKSINNERSLSKKSPKRCSSSSFYRQRLERIRTNCQLIREQRRRQIFTVLPIELRPSLFQQRHYQMGSLESLNVADKYWQSTNYLRLSDEYLYKCKYAIFSTTSRHFKQNEFYRYLKNLFSLSSDAAKEYNENLYSCQLCNHTFHSNDMFDLHFNRRSVSMEYRCLTCQSLIKASNPCQAYYHLLVHSNITREKRIGQFSISYNADDSLININDTFAKYLGDISTDELNS